MYIRTGLTLIVNVCEFRLFEMTVCTNFVSMDLFDLQIQDCKNVPFLFVKLWSFECPVLFSRASTGMKKNAFVFVMRRFYFYASFSGVNITGQRCL